MQSEIQLMMSNITHEGVDLVHQVSSFPNTVWANPYNNTRSFTDQVNNYKKYTNFLSNMLFLKVEPYVSEYDKLLERAIHDKKLVFECTCFPHPCHLDAIRERLTKDLQEKGFTVTTNRDPLDLPQPSEERSDDDN